MGRPPVPTALSGGVQGFDDTEDGVAAESRAVREDVEVWCYDGVELRNIFCADRNEECVHCVYDLSGRR